jgi:hypothetical protein
VHQDERQRLTGRPRAVTDDPGEEAPAEAGLAKAVAAEEQPGDPEEGAQVAARHTPGRAHPFATVEQEDDGASSHSVQS